ncbi:hypothetical protein D3C85_1074230 [compost metagenome]
MLHRPLQIEPIHQPLSLDVQRYRCGPRGLAVEGAGGRAETAVVAQRLHLGRNGQCVTQALVLNDGALVDLREPVVGGVGQGSAIRPQLDAPVRILGHLDVAMDQAAVFRKILQQV